MNPLIVVSVLCILMGWTFASLTCDVSKSQWMDRHTVAVVFATILIPVGFVWTMILLTDALSKL